MPASAPLACTRSMQRARTHASGCECSPAHGAPALHPRSPTSIFGLPMLSPFHPFTLGWLIFIALMDVTYSAYWVRGAGLRCLAAVPGRSNTHTHGTRGTCGTRCPSSWAQVPLNVAFCYTDFGDSGSNCTYSEIAGGA